MQKNDLLASLATVGEHPVEAVVDLDGKRHALGRVSARQQLKVYGVVARVVEKLGGTDVQGQNAAAIISGLASSDEAVADALDEVFTIAWPSVVADLGGRPTDRLDLGDLVGAILPFSGGPLARAVRALGMTQPET